MSSIILGVSGSIAAYRACDLARDLMRMGHEVRVCLTDSAQRFVSVALFEALTGQPCLQDVFEEPERGRMAHIDWARKADLLIIAPATANTLANLAYGKGEDMLSAIALVSVSNLLIAPAMNPSMFTAQSTQTSISILRARGAVFVEPQEGDVACGETGQGKLAANEEILKAAEGLLVRSNALSRQRILITSGPTREPIDPVRFLSNRSSGKMGAALARAALQMGADVTVITGPTHESFPPQVRVIRVETALQMLSAAKPHAETADWIIGAAAVADYRPAEAAQSKIRRSSEPIQLNLVPNPDVIAELAKVTKGKVVGFAAEPSTDPAEARAKITRKGLYAIALNDISNPSVGFDSDQNQLILLSRDREPIASGTQSKLNCAIWLFDNLIKL